MKLINSEVRIETTNRCNSHCIMCPREKLTRPVGVMDKELFHSIIDEIKDYGVTNIFLGGYGEALLDPHIVYRVNAVKKMGLFSNFISNGSMMDNEKAEALIDAGLDEVRFSVYGTTKQTYEKVHAGLSFEKTRENILNLISLRNKMGKKTPRVYVFFLMLEENVHEGEDFKKQWGHAADAIEIWKPHNFGDGRSFRCHDGKKVSCGRPQRGPIQIQWDGLVIPCCWDYNGVMVLGDMNKNSLKEILKGDNYRAIRDAHDEGEFHKYPFCNNCDQLQKKEDALVYSSRHNLPAKEAMKLTNSNLFSLK